MRRQRMKTVDKGKPSKASILTSDEVNEFKRLVFEAYSVVLTNEEAMDQGSRLIQLFELILRNKTQQSSPLQNSGKRGNNE